MNEIIPSMTTHPCKHCGDRLAIADPMDFRYRDHLRGLCSICLTAHEMVHTSADDAAQAIRRADIDEVYMAARMERAGSARKVVLAALERRARKLLGGLRGEIVKE